VIDAPTNPAARFAVVGILVIGALVAGCADAAKGGEVDAVLAQLRSAEPAERYEAVVRLGMLPPSVVRRDGLAGAVRDSDETVRLMAAIVVLGDGPTEHASWLRTRRDPPAPTLPSTPNPSPREDLSPVEELVALDPRFAGTLLPFVLVAARNRDERVRALANRTLQHTKPQERRDGSQAGRGPADR
jgi:hypothetical protein